MPRRLHRSDPDFDAALSRLLSGRQTLDDDVNAHVAAIIADVRKRGDAALFAYAERFDGARPESLILDDDRRRQAAARVAPETREALEIAAQRIEAAHRSQTPQTESHRDALGVSVEWVWKPLDSAALYIPGGTARYPSSTLMNAIPAKIAGVSRIVMTTPIRNGEELDPAVAAAAEIAGVDVIHPLGGAHAIAALAFGSETIRPVDKIVGPANAYVSAAKRQVFGHVGIDMIAGPSEVLIVADADNHPEWIAADLLAQAEHDEAAQAILIADDPAFADAVAASVDRQLAALPRRKIAGAAWDRHGAVIIVDDLDAQAPAVVDRIAPEHLQLCLPDPAAMAGRIRHAGAVFLGASTPEALGDYVIGANHVLPTSQSARFSSGLSVFDFLKRTAILHCPQDAFPRLAPTAIALAREEGLQAHALSLSRRLNPAAETS